MPICPDFSRFLGLYTIVDAGTAGFRAGLRRFDFPCGFCDQRFGSEQVTLLAPTTLTTRIFASVLLGIFQAITFACEPQN